MPKKPIKLPEVGWIVEKHLRKSVEALLRLYPSYLAQPSSVSGKHHKGETRKKHVQMALQVVKWICEELQIKGLRRDKIVAAMILHDIGYVTSLKKGNVPGWTYYEATGWSSSSRQRNIGHPTDGFKIVLDSDIREPHKTDIANMVLKHMAHWYCTGTPNPETEDEKIVAISDFLASRKDLIFVGIDVEDWRK